MEISTGEQVYVFWLAMKNAHEAIVRTPAYDGPTKASPINKALRRNRQLISWFGWKFEEGKTKKEMIIETREWWYDFGDLLTKLEAEYGIEYEE